MARVKVLKEKDLKEKLKKHPKWSINKARTQIAREFKLPNFVTSLALAAKITVHAEVMDHHPDLELSYGKLRVKLTTHSAKGLTNKDFELAGKIDSLKENQS